MKKRKVKISRLLLLIAIVLLLAIALFFGIGKLFSRNPEPSVPDNSNIIESNDDRKVIIDVLDYLVFADAKEKVGFDFVVARLRFTSRDGSTISYDLKDLYTSERLQLDNGRYYADKLSEKSYYLSSLNVTYEIKELASKDDCLIVIPYADSSDKLTISDAEGLIFEFDLSDNLHSIEELQYTSGSDIAIGGSFEAYLSDAYITQPQYMQRNGEDMDYPSTVQIYTFKLHINSIDEEGIYIAKAEFVSDTLEEGIYYALDDSFSSIKASNIINKPLNKDDEAALFFEIINVDGSAPDFKGTLRLMMSNQNDWIEISAK